MTRLQSSSSSGIARAMFVFRLVLTLSMIVVPLTIFGSKSLGQSQLLIAPAGFSQEGSMSYDETVDWIKDKSNQSVKMATKQPEVYVNMGSSDLQIDGCTLSWKYTVVVHNGTQTVFNNNSASLSMREVASVEVVTDPGIGAGLFSVVLKIADLKKNVTVKISQTFKGTADDTRHVDKTEMHDGAGILFDDEATARKFSKAMQYVIKHCGDK